jgi:hypothetical protein
LYICRRHRHRRLTNLFETKEKATAERSFRVTW